LPFQSCPNIAECVIHGTIDGVSIANVLHFEQPGGYNQTSMDALTAAVAAQVTALYQLITNESVSFDGVSARGLASIIDISSFDSSATGPGADTSASLPANVSSCVTLRTGFTGRSARGRFYAFPIGTAVLSSVNTVSTTYASDLVSFLENAASSALLAGWNWVVLSRRTAGVERPFGIGTQITAPELRNRITDSQRSRLPKGH